MVKTGFLSTSLFALTPSPGTDTGTFILRPPSHLSPLIIKPVLTVLYELKSVDVNWSFGGALPDK